MGLAPLRSGAVALGEKAGDGQQLFDAQIPGSGTVFDWDMLQKLPKTEKLTFLAGGLDHGNVKDALAATGVDGVDTSSGVERADGNGKDPQKIYQFVNQVRSYQS